MRKHILGFAIFNFIFASFAVAFAYFYAPPIPRIAEVNQQPPVFKPEFKRYCHNKKTKSVSAEVISSQFISGKDKIFSKVKISWNGFGAPPEKLYVTTLIFTPNGVNKESFGTYQILEQPFKDASEKTFTLISSASGTKKIDENTNLYARFRVTENDKSDKLTVEKELTDAVPVFYVHGDDFVIEK